MQLLLLLLWLGIELVMNFYVYKSELSSILNLLES